MSKKDKLEMELGEVFGLTPHREVHIKFILDSYAEPWRQYHNCDHILLALNLVKQLEPQISARYRHALRVMIIYHDVVYKLGREKGWNERESGVVAGKHLTAAGYDPEFIELVVAGIECTIDHTVPESLSNWAPYIEPLLDVDLLAGLGTSWEEFSNRTRLIGLEYSPLYTEEEYRSGRIKFAQTFLERTRIFHDPRLQEYEILARENLQRTIQMLSQ